MWPENCAAIVHGCFKDREVYCTYDLNPSSAALTIICSRSAVVSTELVPCEKFELGSCFRTFVIRVMEHSCALFYI